MVSQCPSTQFRNLAFPDVSSGFDCRDVDHHVSCFEFPACNTIAPAGAAYFSRWRKPPESRKQWTAPEGRHRTRNPLACMNLRYSRQSPGEFISHSSLICRPSGAFGRFVVYRWLAPPAKLCRPAGALRAAAPHTTIDFGSESVRRWTRRGAA